MKHIIKFSLYIFFLSFATNQALTPAQEHLIQSLYDSGVFKFGNFTLKSGKTSSFYIDMRTIISYPKILAQVVECMHEILCSCEYERICGVPYSGLVIATAVSLAHQKPMILKRKEAKIYGTQKMIEGVYKPEDRCLVIEDVITTGQSILETTTVLETEGLLINDIIVLIDREEGGIAHVARKGYTIHALLTLREIALYLHIQQLISTQEFENMITAITSNSH